MTWSSDHHHGRRDIRATGVDPCDSARHDSAKEAVARIQALRESERPKYIASHCCRCRGWHVSEARGIDRG